MLLRQHPILSLSNHGRVPQACRDAQIAVAGIHVPGTEKFHHPGPRAAKNEIRQSRSMGSHHHPGGPELLRLLLDRKFSALHDLEPLLPQMAGNLLFVNQLSVLRASSANEYISAWTGFFYRKSALKKFACLWRH